jgi:hypothetical protein
MSAPGRVAARQHPACHDAVALVQRFACPLLAGAEQAISGCARYLEPVHVDHAGPAAIASSGRKAKLLPV